MLSSVTINTQNGRLVGLRIDATPPADVYIIGQTHSSLIKLCKTAHHHYWIEETIDCIHNATPVFQVNMDNGEYIDIEYLAGNLLIDIYGKEPVREWVKFLGVIPYSRETEQMTVKYRTVLHIGGKGWLTEGGPLVSKYYAEQNRLADIREGYLKKR